MTLKLDKSNTCQTDADCVKIPLKTFVLFASIAVLTSIIIVMLYVAPLMISTMKNKSGRTYCQNREDNDVCSSALVANFERSFPALLLPYSSSRKEGKSVEDNSVVPLYSTHSLQRNPRSGNNFAKIG